MALSSPTRTVAASTRLHPEVLPGAARRAGLPVISFHGLRHGAATAGLAAGVPLLAMSKRLGHSSVSITADRYSHVVEQLEQGDRRTRRCSPGPAGKATVTGRSIRKAHLPKGFCSRGRRDGAAALCFFREIGVAKAYGDDENAEGAPDDRIRQVRLCTSAEIAAQKATEP